MNANSNQSFPLIDALLQLPEEGQNGSIGICTNTTAPGQVLNMLDPELRPYVSVLGSLIVNRDGTERMIINALVHPTLRYIILFAEEGLTFSPSTNLLLAIQHGYESDKKGNFIKGGRAASAHYPNVPDNLLELFRNNITVLPIFVYKSNFSKQIVADYLAWLEPKVDAKIFALVQKINQKDKVYYDALKELIRIVGQTETTPKQAVELAAKDFQHLQPPRITIDAPEEIVPVPFRVRSDNKNVVLDIRIDDQNYTIQGDDDFLVSYSLMKFLGEKKKSLTARDQLLLGAELGLMKTHLSDGVPLRPLTVTQPEVAAGTEIALEPKVFLQPDKNYYYRIGLAQEKLSIMCMAFDVCEEVFDLRSSSFTAVINRLAELNRFEDYEMDILHRMDVGAQIGRAYLALKEGYAFMQDFPNLFKVNTTNLPLVIADSDTFLATHKSVLQLIYTKGLTEEHGDPWKGLARSAVVLAVYRQADQALATMPLIYKQGDQSPEAVRAAYRDQLLRFDHDGSYSYGERTRSFFGFDQLPRAVESLQKHPHRATIVQRFDPAEDMSSWINAETGKMEFSHDPCLTHDIFWTQDGKLYSFHIARAHNTVNAYPENIFGLYDAYVQTILDAVKLPMGDMFMLSSRANILLLTEEQRTKKLLGEPSKPAGNGDSHIGPYLLGGNVKVPEVKQGLAYSYTDLVETTKRPTHPILARLENYRGQNVLQKAITYLKEKGINHNNPIISSYHAQEDDPQSDCLVFLQANVMGKKLHMTAVFANRSLDHQAEDRALLNYVATQYSQTLGYPLGALTTFYVAY